MFVKQAQSPLDSAFNIVALGYNDHKIHCLSDLAGGVIALCTDDFFLSVDIHLQTVSVDFIDVFPVRIYEADICAAQTKVSSNGASHGPSTDDGYFHTKTP